MPVPFASLKAALPPDYLLLGSLLSTLVPSLLELFFFFLALEPLSIPPVPTLL